MTPINYKYMIEITTDSEYNITDTYEWLAKTILQFGKNGYLKENGDPVTHIKDIRLWKVLPERTNVVDRKAVKRITDD